jgi:hypothetical protein
MPCTGSRTAGSNPALSAALQAEATRRCPLGLYPFPTAVALPSLPARICRYCWRNRHERPNRTTSIVGGADTPAPGRNPPPDAQTPWYKTGRPSVPVLLAFSAQGALVMGRISRCLLCLPLALAGAEPPLQDLPPPRPLTGPVHSGASTAKQGARRNGAEQSPSPRNAAIRFPLNPFPAPAPPVLDPRTGAWQQVWGGPDACFPGELLEADASRWLPAGAPQAAPVNSGSATRAPNGAQSQGGASQIRTR